MKKQKNIVILIKPFVKILGTTFGAIAVLCTVCGFAYALGKDLEEAKSQREISELNNKHTLEIIELKNQILLLQFQQRELQNEKGKAKK